MIQTLRLRDRRNAITRFTGFRLLTSLADQREVPVETDGTLRLTVGPLPGDGTVVVSLRAPEGNLLFTRDLESATWSGAQPVLLEFDSPAPALAPAVPAIRPRVVGRLLDLNASRSLDNVQIVLFSGVPSDSPASRPIAAFVTETGGYFSFAHPVGLPESVVAVVGVPTTQPRHPVPVTLGPDGQFQLPSPLLLVVELAPVSEATPQDCGCKSLGDFHTQNRVLEEFSYCAIVRTTDPEIQAFTVEEPEEIELEALIPPAPHANPVDRDDLVFGVRDLAISPGRSLTRATGSSSAPAPAAAAPPKVNLRSVKVVRSVARSFLDRHGVITRANLPQLLEEDQGHRQKAALRRGVTSAMGRAELSTLNMVDWDETPTQYMATSIAYGHVLYFKQSWVADGYSLGDLLYSLPLAPGQKKQVAIVDFERRDQATNSQQLEYRESLQNLLSRDRDINEIAHGVVSESMDASSKAHVAAGAAGIGGAIGPIVFGAAGGYSRSWSTASQDSMRSIGASNLQSLTDRTVQSASAVRGQRSTVVQTVSQNETLEVTTESVANYNHCHAITIQYFEVLRHFKVVHRLSDVQECLFVPLPLSAFDLDKARRWREPLQATLRDRSLRPAFEALDRVQDRWAHSNLPQSSVAAEQVRSLSGSLKVAFRFARPADRLVTVDEVETLQFVPENWEWMMPLLQLDPAEFFNRHLKESVARDEVFQRRLGTLIARAVVNALELRLVGSDGQESAPLSLDATLAGEYRAGAPIEVTLRFTPPIGRTRLAIQYVKVGLKADLALPAFTAVTVRSGIMSYRTDHYAGVLFNHRSLNDDLAVGDSVLIEAPVSREEMREPKNDDLDLANRLLHHLNANLEFYHTMIFHRMSPERRFMLLDGIQLSLPRASESEPVRWRSVASLVENKLLAVIGNSLVLPVVPGLNLNPEFQLGGPAPADGSQPRTLIDYYQPQAGEPIRLSVPTKGVFAEAMMGSCNSCETIDETRFWRWEQSPIPDSPTTISPVGAESRRADPGNLQPAPLSSPVVNIQNAPAAPDPSGLSQVLGQLGRSDTFRDITGLAENQRNALGGLQQSLGAAQAFGKMGVEWNQFRTEAELRRERMKAATDLLDKKKISVDTWKEMMAVSNPELDRVRANNQAAERDEITQDQLDVMNPQTEPQRFARLQAALNTVREAVQNKIMSPEEGSRVSGEIVRASVMPGGSSPSAQAKDLAGAFPAGLASASVDSEGGITLSGPAVAPVTSLLDVETVNSGESLTFGHLKGDISGSTPVLAVGRPAANARWASSAWTNLTPNRIELIDEEPQTVTVRALRAGRAELLFEVRDAAQVVVDYRRIPLSVPRYYHVVEVDAYEVEPGLVPPGVADPTQFNGVLRYAQLLEHRVEIFRRGRAVAEDLLKGVNVRLIWKMMDQALPARLPMASLSPVKLFGFVGTAKDAIGISTTDGSDVGDSSTIIVQMGSLVDRKSPQRAAEPLRPGSLQEAIEPILRVLLAPETSVEARQALIPLWREIFARTLGFAIAHEVGHTILREQAHTSEFDPDDLMGSGSDPLDIGLQITNAAAFPAPGSFTWTEPKRFNEKNLARLKKDLPVATDPPFDSFFRRK